MARPRTLGVLGGLGPVATARFLSSVYAHNQYEREQNMPSVIVYSDPSFPDRTEEFLRGEFDVIRNKTIDALERLESAGATKVIICCFTLHHIVDSLPERLRRRLILLTDLAIRAAKNARSTLLLCTTGSRKLGVFERHNGWAGISKNVILPSDEDQERIHSLIYRLKLNLDPARGYFELAPIVRRYPVESCIFGCTDLHILSNARSGDDVEFDGIGVIDPLIDVVHQLHSGELFDLPDSVG